MALTLALIGALAYWDATRESAAGLNDFADEQATLSQALAVSLRVRLQSISHDAELALSSSSTVDSHRYRATKIRPPSEPSLQPIDSDQLVLSVAFPDHNRVVDLAIVPTELLASASALEHRAGIVCLIQVPGASQLLTIDGGHATSTAIMEALGSNASFVRLSRGDSAALGLPERTAIAGLAHLNMGGLGNWGIATVASAERLRDRQFRSQWRLIMSIALASALVLAFGGFAFWRQRSAFALSHRLAIFQLQSERDERLSKANRAATLGTIAMGITHEISTPLGIIAGRADQLSSRATDPDKVQHS